MRIIIILMCLHCAAAGAAPRVVTTIPPLQELTAALMADVGEPEVLIDSHAAVHHFALKPSQLRRLQQADLVIRVGGNFESGFDRLVEILPASVRQLELLPALGMDPDDGHFWYAPDALRASVDAITAALALGDPANRNKYEANAVALITAIEQWRNRIEARLGQRPVRVVTDHDFLAQFARAFGLDPIDSIHDRHDDHAGLKQLLRLETGLQQRGVACLLTQSPEVSPLAAALARKYRLSIIDIGRGRSPVEFPPTLLARLERLGDALEQCG